MTEPHAAPPPAHPPPTPSETQAERTRLAWRRTTLAATLAVLLIGRLAIHDGPDLLAALGLFLALMGWLGFIWLTHRRIKAMAQHEPATIGRTLPTVALTVLGFAVVGILLVITGGVVG